MEARLLERWIDICDSHQKEKINSCKSCPIKGICKEENLKNLYNVKTISELKIKKGGF